MNVTDPAQRPLVDRYHVERAPMPMVLCIAPNGAITGGITRQLTDAAVDKVLRHAGNDRGDEECRKTSGLPSST